MMWSRTISLDDNTLDDDEASLRERVGWRALGAGIDSVVGCAASLVIHQTTHT